MVLDINFEKIKIRVIIHVALIIILLFLSSIGFLTSRDNIYPIDGSGPIKHSRGTAIVIDPLGNTYVGAESNYDLFSSKSVIKDSSDVRLFKLSPEKELLWIQNIGGDGDDMIEDIVMDQSGDLIIVGTSNSVILEGNISDQNCDSTFLFKIDGESGNILWQRFFSATGCWANSIITEERIHKVMVNQENEIFIAGSTVSKDFTNVTTSAYRKTSFLMKLSSEGIHEWTYEVYTLIGSIFSFAFDQDSNILIVGSIFNRLARVNGFQSNLITDTYTCFIAKISETGNLIWGKVISGDADVYGMDIAIDNLNNIYIAGYTFSDKIEGVDQDVEGPNDLILVKMNSEGDLILIKKFGGNGSDVYLLIELFYLAFVKIQILDSGDIIVASTSYSELGEESRNQGSYDIALWKLDTASEIITKVNIGGSLTDMIFGICASVNGITLTGFTYSHDYPLKADDVRSQDIVRSTIITEVDSNLQIIWSETL